VRELERLLRQTQEQTLAGTAQAVATALHNRPRLFERPPVAPQPLPLLRAEPASPPSASGAAAAGEAVTLAPLAPPPAVIAKPLAQPDPGGEIEQIISGLSRTTGRIWVVDRDLRVLARAGSLHAAPPRAEDTGEGEPSRLARVWETLEERVLNPVLNPLYAMVLREPREDFADDLAQAAKLEGKEVESALSGIIMTRRWPTSDDRAMVISAAHPIWVGDTVRGAVVVEETTNPVLAQRNRAFARLFDIVLTALLLGSAALLVFAKRLSDRIRKLRNEAEQAIDAHGRIRQIATGSQARDEIGDLSRSFSEMLAKLAQYTSYQENMATRLSHELRTPIAVVRSSLENLDQTRLPEESRVYMARAREGLDRLNHIFTSMAEATRLDQMLHESDRERFDLARVVASCVEGYRIAYAQRSFELDLPGSPVFIVGVPDALAQLLDKLIANAADFATPGTPIRVALQVHGSRARLSVDNDGPLLPAEMAAHLFDSMVSVRRHRGGDMPHLGLGLYIVRIIAEFHEGEASLRNRADGRGVFASVTLRTVY
jgi:dedicated sortase system histidine kinase